MSENEFKKQSRESVEFMKEMNKRSTNKSDNIPPQRSKSIPQKTTEPPFFGLLKNSDTALILGLLLLLYSENADKKLLFALIYILL